MLRVVVLIRLTRFGRQRLLGRNLITVFFTVNTRPKKKPRRRRRTRRRTRASKAMAERRLRALPADAFQSDAENKSFFSGATARPDPAHRCGAIRRAPSMPLATPSRHPEKTFRRRFRFASHKPICAELRRPETAIDHVPARPRTCSIRLDGLAGGMPTGIARHPCRSWREVISSWPGSARASDRAHTPPPRRPAAGQKKSPPVAGFLDASGLDGISRPRPRSTRRSRPARAARPAARRRRPRPRTASPRRRRPR